MVDLKVYPRIVERFMKQFENHTKFVSGEGRHQPVEVRVPVQVREVLSPQPVDLDALDALRAASVHRSKWAGYNSALHNAYPAIAAELRALRGKVEVLEAEAKQHDYDLTQTINERDEMEERVNAIAGALLLPEPEQEWTSANDVGERCVEAAEALRERAYKLYKGLREVVFAVGGVAGDGVSDEFLLNAAGEVRALRKNRNELRARVAELEAANGN